jgi:hypothetical protein
MPVSFRENLISILQNLDQYYHPNELAYLALTSKAETTIRDKVAFQLYSHVDPKAYQISREWKKVDLAIVNNSIPQTLIEFKAMYTFDCKTYRRFTYGDLVIKDLIKAQNLSNDITEIFGILISTHINSSVPHQLNGIIKYINDINDDIRLNTIASFTRGNQKCNKDYMIEKANKVVITYFNDKDIHIESGFINVGEVYNIPVSIHYYLIGPVNKNSILQL